MGKWGLVVVALIAAACWWLLVAESSPLDEQRGGLDRPPSAVPSESARAAPRAGSAQPTQLDLPVETPSEPAAPPWPDDCETMTVSGRVLDARGVGVPGAQVVAFPDGRTRGALGLQVTEWVGTEEVVSLQRGLLHATRTDEHGRFTLRAPWHPNAVHQLGEDFRVFPQLLVLAEGYAVHNFPCIGYAGGVFAAGDLQLEHLAAGLRAHFVDPTGRAIPAVSVKIDDEWSAIYPRHKRYPAHGLPAFGVRSDARGDLFAEQLWGGEATFTFLHEDFVPVVHTVELSAGHVFDLGTLVLEPLGGLRGTVYDANGEPLAGAHVSASPKSFERWIPPDRDMDLAYFLSHESFHTRPGVSTDAQGRYELGRLDRESSHFFVSAVADGFEPVFLEPVPVDSGGNDLRLVPEASLLVHVVDALTGEPIPEATLEAFRDLGRMSSWQSPPVPDLRPLEVDGERVHRVGPYGTRLLAFAPGRAPRMHDEPGSASGSTRELTLKLEPATLLSFRVIDDRSEPIAGASVTLWPAASWGLGQRGQHSALKVGATTDAEGRAELRGASPGQWELTVAALEHQQRTDWEFEVPVDDAEFTVRLQRSSGLDGRLWAAEGVPAVGVNVNWFVNQQRRRWVVTDLEGRFAMPGLSGDGELRAPGVEPTPISLPPGELVEVELFQQLPFVVAGWAHAAGVPLNEVQVQVVHGVSTPRSLTIQNGLTGSDGRFQVEAADAGALEVWVLHANSSQVQRIEAHPGGRADLEFAFGTASLAGRLVLENAVIDLTQLYLKLEVDGEPRGSTQPDSDGSFHFGGLHADSYEIVSYGGASITTRGGPFELADNEQRAGIELRVNKAALLSGRALHADGTPFSGFVHLRSVDGAHYELAWTKQGTGAFEFRRLHPGEWQLDLATQHVKSLGEGADGVEGVGEPGAELPFFARELITLAPGEEREVDVIVPEGAPR